ncbi:MAG: hypothetical protein M1827_004888 [Pycnora praestabilis]|nr:MAG: hypothetical protein M1827_004888 [Pycnora praestabilis]
MATPQNEWETATKSGLLSVGTHRLHLSVSGPPRTPGSPIVIVEAGSGCSSHGWIAITRKVSSFARILIYDRAGLGQSESSPGPFPRTSEAIAGDLHALLETADIGPPYIMVGHSYSGIQIRKYVAMYADEVVGLVFVDANGEKAYTERPFKREHFEVMNSLDYLNITGVDENYKGLTEEEYTMLSAEKKGEDLAYEEAAVDIGKYNQYEKKVMGKAPVIVVKGNTWQDFRKLVEVVEERGLGTQEQRLYMRENLLGYRNADDRLQREQLRLSDQSKWVQAEHSGHLIYLLEPEIVVSAIEWVVDESKAVANRND